MSRTILWAEEATSTFESIVEFLEEKWGFAVTQKFIARTNEVLITTAEQPYLFKASPFARVRKGMINKHCSFFYQVETTHITILFFWDKSSATSYRLTFAPHHRVRDRSGKPTARISPGVAAKARICNV